VRHIAPPTVGLLTVSDGRASVHGDVGPFAQGVEDQIARSLEAGGARVVRAAEVIWTNELAVSEARRVADARPDLTIVNIPVWAFPHFTMRAARELTGPLLLFSNVDPQYPGMVGMLAAAGALDQIGRPHGRAWGEIEDAGVQARVDAHLRAAAAPLRSLPDIGVAFRTYCSNFGLIRFSNENTSSHFSWVRSFFSSTTIWCSDLPVS